MSIRKKLGTLLGVVVTTVAMTAAGLAAAPAAQASLCCDLGRSDARPALANFTDGSGRVVAWKGGSGDNSIYVTLNPFVSSNRAGGAQTDQGPAVGTLGRRVFVAYKGVGADTQIYVTSSTDTVSWTPPFAIPGASTDSMPSMATKDNTLYLAWKTPGQGLWWSWSTDGAPGTWAPGSGAIHDGGSSLGPSLTATRNGLALGWKGLNADPRVFYARYEGGRWSPQQEGPAGAGTTRPPSLTAGDWFGDGLRFSWAGGLRANYLVYTSYLSPNSGAWTANHTLPLLDGTSMRSKDGPSIIAAVTSNGDHRIVDGAWEDFVADFAEFTNSMIVGD